MNKILFIKDHTWRIQPIKFEMGSTIPINEIFAEYESTNDSGSISVSEILNRDVQESDSRNKNFYEILECMETMNTFQDLLHLYIMGSSHISKSTLDLSDEVKGIETLKTWIEYANELHSLLDIKEKVVLTDNLILKVARETRPTLFQMPNNERIYEDSKSVITFLSPYEDNTKALKEKNKSKNCVTGKYKISKFLKEGKKFEV